MKKYLLTAFVMLSMSAIVKAEILGTPRGGPQALATADYGGYHLSTYTISSLISGTGVGYSTVTIPGLVGVPLNEVQSNGMQGVFAGIQYGTGTTSDFTDVYDSTSSDAGKNSAPMTRIYNVGSSTGGAGAFAAGFSGPDKPIRFGKGLILRPSRADFNSFGALFYVFQ